MPVHKTSGGYKWGKHGHTYKTKAGAERQARAIFASGYKGKSLDGGSDMTEEQKLAKSIDALIDHLSKDISIEAEGKKAKADDYLKNKDVEESLEIKKSAESTKAYQGRKHQEYSKKTVKSGNVVKSEVRNKFAVATAAAKKAGYSDFSEGAKGREKRDEIAESVAEKKMIDNQPPKLNHPISREEAVKRGYNHPELMGKTGRGVVSRDFEPDDLDPEPTLEKSGLNQSRIDAINRKNKLNRADTARDKMPRPEYPQNYSGPDIPETMDEPNVEKDWKSGAAIGAGIGALAGNPVVGALVGGGIGHMLDKKKKAGMAPSGSNKEPDVRTVKPVASAGGFHLVRETKRSPQAEAASAPREASVAPASESYLGYTMGPKKKEAVKPVAAKKPEQEDLMDEHNMLSLDTMISKSQATLRVRKAITLLEGYSPMMDADVKKAFGDIPSIMKDEENRPPADWFEFAVKELQPLTDKPRSVAVNFWYGKDLEQKLIGGALLGGGIGALTGNPLAGAAIGAGAEETVPKLLGKDIDIDPTALGQAVLDAIKKVQSEKKPGEELPPDEINDIAQKAVAEALSSKNSPQKDEREPKYDNGGQSETYDQGASVNAEDLAGDSKVTSTF